MMHYRINNTARTPSKLETENIPRVVHVALILQNISYFLSWSQIINSRPLEGIFSAKVPVHYYPLKIYEHVLHLAEVPENPLKLTAFTFTSLYTSKFQVIILHKHSFDSPPNLLGLFLI